MQRLSVLSDAFNSDIRVTRAIDIDKLLSLYQGRYKARVEALVRKIIGELCHQHLIIHT